MKLTLDISDKDIENMMPLEGVIYEAIDQYGYGREPYDPDPHYWGWKYDCYMPAITGDYGIIDCWVCDRHGNIHPGYNTSPVPINTRRLGKVMGTIQEQ